MARNVCLLAAALAALARAAPEPTANPNANPVGAPEPAVTAMDINQIPTRTFKGRRRDILSDVNGDINSVLGGQSSYVASGVPQWYESLPTGDQVASSLSISDIQATPTSVNNFPPYANWTDQGWNVRFHGNIYRQPNTPNDTLNDRANDFLLGTSIQQLPPDQADQARNVTAEIFIVQDANAPAPIFTLEPAPSAGSSGQQGGGGAVTSSGGDQTIQFPYNATTEGDFDSFIPITSNGLTAGNQTNQIQRLNVLTNGSDIGNATAYLVPPTGLTIVSDIDDILRVTKIWSPSEIILNTFARPYVPWLNMPSIYANWSAHLAIDDQATHFHYLTTLPEQVTRNYEQFIYATYPGGSFDTRPLNFSDVSATLSIRKYLLEMVFATFPQRKFILVADTSNGDVMKDYPAMYHEHPDQVQCIFLRNTSATDPTLKFPYDTSGFQGIPQDNYMFFVTPDDLTNLDIAGGKCWNQSVIQNVTFGYQGLPLGINLGGGHKGDAAALRARGLGWAAVSLAAGLAAWNLL